MGIPTLIKKGSLVDPLTGQLSLELEDKIPYLYILDWLKIRLDKTGIENRVLVLKSETGSGKSTLLPAEIFRHLIMNNKQSPGLICTEPRRISAINLTQTIIHHSGPDYSKFLKLGETIGFSTKTLKRSVKINGILFSTIGVLLQQLKTFTDKELMERYKFILIDEAHERDIQLDITLMMLKKFIMRNKDNINCPMLILMSATFDPNDFLNYFNISIKTNFIWCKGNSYPIITHWDWNDNKIINDYPLAIYNIVEKICIENIDDGKYGDILVFLPGAKEIKFVYEKLELLNIELYKKINKVFECLSIDSTAQALNNKDYQLFNSNIDSHSVTIEIDNNLLSIKPSRKVILSTNVAETGLTIEELKYVIDAGFNREVEYFPIYNINGLLTKPAPQSRIIQRRGRVGRKFPGEFYPLYPQYIYDKLSLQQLPNILCSDITSELLNIIKMHNNFLEKNLDMLNSPSLDALAQACKTHYSIGSIDKNLKITEMGEIINSLNTICPQSARMILASYMYPANTLDIITIAAWIAKDVDAEMKSNKGELITNWDVIYKLGAPKYCNDVNKINMLICDEFINGIFLLNTIESILSKEDPLNKLNDFCVDNNIKINGIINFLKLRDDIINQMLENNLNIRDRNKKLINCTIEEFTNTLTAIKYCIYDGYKNNIMTLQNSFYYSQINIKTPEIINSLPSDIEMPINLIYANKILKLNKKSNIYIAEVDKISMLDGYITIL